MTRKNMSAVVTWEHLRSILEYDPFTGEFKWRDRERRPAYFTRKVGTLGSNGRLYIGIDGRQYLAHRLAWFYMSGKWPEKNVVPEDGDYLNLTLNNLVLESPADTVRKRHQGSRSVGVSWDKEKKRWLAKITINYKQIALGRFRTKEEAIRAVRTARKTIAYAPEEMLANDEASLRREKYRVDANYRRLWTRTLKAAGGVTGWESFEHFATDLSILGLRENRSLEAIDPGTKIGPGNCQWRETLHSSFDHKTREGRIAYDKAHRAAFPMVHREHDLRKTFGLTLAQYNALYEAQGGVCAICEQPERERRNGKTRWLAVDHCHESGTIRGLLCGRCNRGIGKFRDDPQLMWNAKAYLERYEKRAKTKHVNNVIPLKPKAG